MAKFLTTFEATAQIERIIKEAKNELTLITPYLKLDQNMSQRLKDADNRNVKIRLIYGKKELQSEEIEQINELKNLELFFCKNLHAKCYFNENLMIITSLNLNKFSIRNNREMGALINREEDGEFYNDAVKETDSILRNSINKSNRTLIVLRGKVTGVIEEEDLYIEFTSGQNQWIPISAIKSDYSLFAEYQDFEIENWCLQYGFCINCNCQILYSPKRSICRDCFYKFDRDDIYYHKEFQYCHKCGKSFSASWRKPLCQECWNMTR